MKTLDPCPVHTEDCLFPRKRADAPRNPAPDDPDGLTFDDLLVLSLVRAANHHSAFETVSGLLHSLEVDLKSARRLTAAFNDEADVWLAEYWDKDPEVDEHVMNTWIRLHGIGWNYRRLVWHLEALIEALTAGEYP